MFFTFIFSTSRIHTLVSRADTTESADLVIAYYNRIALCGSRTNQVTRRIFIPSDVWHAPEWKSDTLQLDDKNFLDHSYTTMLYGRL